MTFATVSDARKIAITKVSLRNKNDEKRRCLPSFIKQKRSNLSHSPRPRIRGTLSHTAECTVDEKHIIRNGIPEYSSVPTILQVWG